MDHENLAHGPVRVRPDVVARWIGAEITTCELEARNALRDGDDVGALGMLARGGGLADAYALIVGACRTCGEHVGRPHRSVTCRSGGLHVGGRDDVGATYCADVAPARVWRSFEAMVNESGGKLL